jgi:DNA-binding response OmpR family regulator
MKILIIEDDSTIVKFIDLTFHIVWPEAEVLSAEWGSEGVELVEKESPSVVILDMGLPDMNGLDVIKEIRSFSKVPIIVLTIDTSEATVVHALEFGANEYIYKPFRQLELVARVKSLIKWHRDIEVGESYIWGPLLFDYNRREVVRNNEVIRLTSIESEILRALINNSPNVVPYNYLANVVWGDYYDGAILSLKVHISHIRKKIEINRNNPLIILSKQGVGYYAIKPGN